MVHCRLRPRRPEPLKRRRPSSSRTYTTQPMRTTTQWRHSLKRNRSTCPVRQSCAANMTPFIKPEIDSPSQLRLRRIESGPMVTCTKLVNIGHAVLEICSQADRQAYRHATPNGGGVMIRKLKHASFNRRKSLPVSRPYYWHCPHSMWNRSM